MQTKYFKICSTAIKEFRKTITVLNTYTGKGEKIQTNNLNIQARN